MADQPTRPTVTHRPATPGTDTSSAAVGGDPTEPAFGPPTHTGELGRLGGFRVLKLLGRGGMGAVYLGFHEGLRRKVALKVMLPKYAADPVAKERFLREARAAAGVRTDHVVTIYDVNEDGGIPFIAMEYLQGYPLDDYLKRKGRLTVPQAVRVGIEAATGLAAAHALGLIHRDIKPANLWLEAPQGRIKILDFGLAKEANRETAQLTGAGAVVGTPAFMSPEQARGDAVDHRTDLFSLGTVLYMLTTGRLPFEGPTVMAILTALATQPPPPVQSLNPEVPPTLAAVIHRLLAKDRESRPASAAEVADALRAIEQGQSNPAAMMSQSAPVLVSGVMQPHVVYVPLEVTAYDNSAFENLDEPAPGSPRREADSSEPSVTHSGARRRRFRLAATLVLLAGIGVGAVTLLKKPAAAVKEKPADPPVNLRVIAPPPPKVADSPDRRLALWVLSKGGSITVTPAAASSTVIRTVAELPAGPFQVTYVVFPNSQYAVADEDLDQFAPATGLFSVTLGTCAVTDAGLEKLCRMPAAAKLAALAFDSPGITETGFRHVALLTRMKVLRVYRAKVADDGLRHVAGLTELGELGLSEAGVTNAGLVHLEGLTKLQILNLFGNDIDDAGTTALTKLSALTELNLSRTQVGDAAAKILAGVPTLAKVHFSLTDVTDAGVAHLAKLSKLSSLSLEGTAVTDAALEHLAGAKNLLNLNVTKTKVTTPAVKRFLAAVPNCKVEFDYKPGDDPDRKLAEWAISKGARVELTGGVVATEPGQLPPGPLRITGVRFQNANNRFGDDDVPRLRDAGGLVSLDVGMSALTDVGFKTLAELPGAARFEVLALRAPAATGAGVAHLAKLPALHTLDVCHVNLGDAGPDTFAGFPKLLSVLARSCNLTDAGLGKLRKRGLQVLAVGGNNAVTDAGVALLVNPNLVIVELSGTGVTDATLERLGKLPMLKSLDLLETAVTDAGLAHLHGCKTLASFSVKGTKVTTAAVKRFLVAVPNCKVTFDYDPKADADRKLAEWVVSKGGKVTTSLAKSDYIADAARLPAEPFGVVVAGGMPDYTVTDADLDLLLQCPTMEWFSPDRTAITDEGLKKLAAAPFAPILRGLGAHSPKVTDAGLDHLKAFPNLGVLSLDGSGVTDAGVRKLAGMTFTREGRLQVIGTKVTPEGVTEFRKAYPGWKVLSSFEKR